MKKTTISLAALALSASASAFVGPIGNLEHKTICLSLHEDAKGAKMLGGCDESHNNHALHKPLNTAGCAEGQAALTASRLKGTARPFSPQIRSCMPPNVAQL